jgi:hypothetical protein
MMVDFAHLFLKGRLKMCVSLDQIKISIKYASKQPFRSRLDQKLNNRFHLHIIVLLHKLADNK